MGFIAVRHICQVNWYSLELPDDLLGESVLVINTAKLAAWHDFVSSSLEGQWWSNCVALQEQLNRLGQRPGCLIQEIGLLCKLVQGIRTDSYRFF